MYSLLKVPSSSNIFGSQESLYFHAALIISSIVLTVFKSNSSNILGGIPLFNLEFKILILSKKIVSSKLFFSNCINNSGIYDSILSITFLYIVFMNILFSSFNITISFLSSIILFIWNNLFFTFISVKIFDSKSSKEGIKFKIVFKTIRSLALHGG